MLQQNVQLQTEFHGHFPISAKYRAIYKQNI